jgi:ribosomal protein S18 acetylase RimI-like enzyme
MNVVGEIKWYLDGDYAHLRFSEGIGSFSIDTVMVPAIHRSKGIGGKLIGHILILADQLGKQVRLSARPIGDTSEERLQRLIAYYQRFGFYVEDRGNSIAYMVRDVPTTFKPEIVE